MAVARPLGARILWDPSRRTLKRDRCRAGLSSHANPLPPNVMAPNLLLHPCSRGFDYNRQDLLAQIQYVGPSLCEQPAIFLCHTGCLNGLLTSRWCICLGTGFEKREPVCRRLIRALQELDVFGFIAAGPGCDPQQFVPLLSTVRVEPHIRQSLLAD